MWKNICKLEDCIFKMSKTTYAVHLIWNLMNMQYEAFLPRCAKYCEEKMQAD